ncbi:recombination-associated protein RdgC [Paraburkholderia sp. UCT31]|uniref:recombination-associated protein RdgC n=1 Tax=Paraburkholderia sp. UCT31 TaxID=2615209 RepID=UPI0016556721|nr:recombination-associated protein RdgC [Paraburkholderia sp. UCT31]MBC8737184.1 recombination-associated protein RdgC [Paraburkholderia sp. UCT31]
MAAKLWFKNLSCFALASFPALSTEDLNELLEKEQFHPCGELDREQHGFVRAYDQDMFVRKAGDAFWVQVKSEHKLLPGNVVKRLLQERVEQIQAKESRRVGKKEKKDLKEMLIEELLPKALTAQSTVTALIDPKAGYLFVDTAGAKKAEGVVSLLLRAVAGIDMARMNFDNSLAGKMADLLLAEENETAFTTDSALVLKGPGTPASTVRFAKFNLHEPEVAAHLTAGLRPTSMELTFNDRINFTLTEPFGIRKLNFLELVQEDLGAADGGNEDELIDSTLTIQVMELRELVRGLTDWLSDAQ